MEFINFIKKNKKLVLICALGIGFILFSMKLTKVREEEFQKEVDQYNNMIEFENNAQLDDAPDANEPYHLHESAEPYLLNRAEFLALFDDIDTGLCVVNSLDNSLKFLNQVLSDIQKFDLDKYYSANEDTLINLYGFKSEDNFKDTINKISEIGVLSDYKIDLDTLNVEGESFTYNLVLIGTNKEITIKTTSIINKDIFSGNIYWREIYD